MKKVDIITVVFSVLALVFLLNALVITITANFNFGHFMMWGIGISSAIYSRFYKQINAFISHGVGLVLAVIFFIGFAFFLVMLGRVLWGQFGNPPTGQEDTIVILGCGINGETPSLMLQGRLDAGYEFYLENTDATIVVCGGQGSNEVITEALAMERYLIEKGVPAEQIIKEDKSTSTQENLMFAVPLLQEQGIDITAPTALVTSGFHCGRSDIYAKKAGFTSTSVVGAGIPFVDVLPSYIREAFAMADYLVFQRA